MSSYKHLPISARTWLGCLLLACSFSALAAENNIGDYDFSYATTGDRSIAPVQVFDSDSKTFIQFNADKPLPAIFAVAPCGSRVLLTPASQGPYVVVPGVYRFIALQFGPRSAQIEYTGSKEIPLEENIANEPNCNRTYGPAYGPAQPIRESFSANPLHGDGPKKVAVRTRATAPSNAVATAVKPAAGSAVASTTTAITQPQADLKVAAVDVRTEPTAPAIKVWTIRSGSKLSEVVKGWAKDSGEWVAYWEAPDLVADADINLTGTFEDAVGKLVEALNAHGAGLFARFYTGSETNKTLRILERK